VKRLTAVSILTLAALAGAVSPSAIARPNAAVATTIAVSGTEFAFTLSKKSGARGVLVFRFANRGKIEHDFKIAGKKTPLLRPGATATLRVKITKPGRYTYICTVPGHAAAGMKGVFVVR
jgi:nitrite reductase (NO-forming)